MGFATQTATFLIYLHIYRFVNEHNSKMLKQTVISKETFKKRKTNNIFTTTAQITMIVIDLSVYIPIVVFRFLFDLSAAEAALAALSVTKMTQSGFISALHVFSSSDLRAELFKFFR